MTYIPNPHHTSRSRRHFHSPVSGRQVRKFIYWTVFAVIMFALAGMAGVSVWFFIMVTVFAAREAKRRCPYPGHNRRCDCGYRKARRQQARTFDPNNPYS